MSTNFLVIREREKYLAIKQKQSQNFGGSERRAEYWEEKASLAARKQRLDVQSFTYADNSDEQSRRKREEAGQRRNGNTRKAGRRLSSGPAPFSSQQRT